MFFGWIQLKASPKEQQFGGLLQFKLRRLDNDSAAFGLYVIACNPIRLSNMLLAQPSPQE